MCEKISALWSQVLFVLHAPYVPETFNFLRRLSPTMFELRTLSDSIYCTKEPFTKFQLFGKLIKELQKMINIYLSIKSITFRKQCSPIDILGVTDVPTWAVPDLVCFTMQYSKVVKHFLNFEKNISWPFIGFLSVFWRGKMSKFFKSCWEF